MKSSYFLDYRFSFADKRALCHKLMPFLNAVVTDCLEKHRYISSNYRVDVRFGNVWDMGPHFLVGKDAICVSVSDKKDAGFVIADLRLSLVSDKVPSVTVGDRIMYSVNFEKDIDLFDFALSYEHVELSDAELGDSARVAFRAFLESFAIPCDISVSNFPAVTFKLKFMEMCEPPTADYVLSLIGCGAVLDRLYSRYEMDINVVFGSMSLFELRDAVARLVPVKDKVASLKII